MIDDTLDKALLDVWANPPFENGHWLFVKVWGSYSHGTQKEGSDIDYSGVYIAETNDILSLNKPPETITRKSPDMEIHEVEKFCRLLLKGNPSQIEALFTTRLIHSSTLRWNELVANRERFLSKVCLKQYLGYANGQLARLKAGTRLHSSGGSYNEKWAYHLIRLLGDALLIARGLGPQVYKTMAELQTLRSIRDGKIDQDIILELAEERFKEIKATPCNIPEESDKDWLNTWLLRIRRCE